MHFGEHIRELRESKELLQHQLAANLEIDTPNARQKESRWSN